MGGFRIEGNVSGNVAEVTSSNELKVTLPTTDANTGKVRTMSENDTGARTGSAYLLSPESSEDYRLRVGVDTLLDSEAFNYTTQNTAKHKYTSTTLAFALSAPFLVTNSTSITAINTGATFSTYRWFPIYNHQIPIYCEFTAKIDAALATNTNIDVGLFNAGTTPTFAPTDGVYFSFTSSGIQGVINHQGTTQTTAVLIASPTLGKVYQFVITITNRSVEFWIDDELYVLPISTPTGNPTPGQNASAPFSVRHAIGGSAASGACQLKIGGYSVSLGDVQSGLPASHQQALMGHGFGQGIEGQTNGPSLTIPGNTVAPTVVTLTAQTAPAVATPGGVMTLPVAIAIGESDYPLYAWQNPAGAVNAPGRTFLCTGARIDMGVTTALTGGPLLMQFQLGYGSTASTLATNESASFAAASTKIARKIPIGMASFAATAAAATVATPVVFDCASAPIAVHPGEFLHLIMRVPGGTATTAGAIRLAFTPIGYWV